MKLLANTRGRGGGLRLAGEPSQVNLGRLVRATEHADVVECFDRDTNTCVLAGRCGLEHVLHEAVAAFYEVLDGHTLEDLIARRRPLQALISLPGRGAHGSPR
jgi:Rrf2 family nitric oxide-sensitive transcriptional repressor